MEFAKFFLEGGGLQLPRIGDGQRKQTALKNGGSSLAVGSSLQRGSAPPPKGYKLQCFHLPYTLPWRRWGDCLYLGTCTEKGKVVTTRGYHQVHPPLLVASLHNRYLIPSSLFYTCSPACDGSGEEAELSTLQQY